MLNEAGGIEADITVTRISEDAFYIITGAAFTHYVHERVITSFQSLHSISKQVLLPFLIIDAKPSGSQIQQINHERCNS